MDYLILSCAILSSSWALLGSSWGSSGPPWGYLGALLGHLGATLGPPRASLGPPWGHLGSSWGHPGPPWGFLGAVMGHLGALLGHALPILCQLGPFWASLGALWALSWPISGPSWSHFGVIRGPSWAHPLILWANRGALLRFPNQPFYLSFSSLPTPKTHLASRSQALQEPRRGREALTIRPHDASRCRSRARPNSRTSKKVPTGVRPRRGRCRTSVDLLSVDLLSNFR